MPERLSRRAALASGATAALAGCLGFFEDDEAGLADHAAGRGLDAMPSLGPDVDEADAVIVAFEDPSCPSCARFEATTVPKIRRNLTEPGKASFVARHIPVIYPWGEPAVHALYATNDRSEAAFWTLQDHYFASQEEFSEAGTGEVYSKTREFLAAETELDASAVIEAAQAGDYDDEVADNRKAAEDAGVSGTPTIFMFKDGEYRTDASGVISFDTIENALGF